MLVVVLHFIFDLHFVVVSSFHFWSSFCCCFLFVDVLYFVVVFHSHFLFDVTPHPSVDYCRVFIPNLYFHPSPSRSGLQHFYFQPFRYLLAASAMALSGHFLLTGIFYLMLLHRHFNLRLSRFHWEPAVLSWNLQGFNTDSRNTDPAHLFVWFLVIHNLHIQNDSVLNSTIYLFISNLFIVDNFR